MANKLKTFLEKHLLTMSNTVKVDGILLAILQGNRVISDGFRDNIDATHGNFVKNSKLWTFIRDSRTDADIPIIVDALEASANAGALDLFKAASLMKSTKDARQYSDKNPTQVEDGACMSRNEGEDIPDAKSKKTYPLNGNLEALIINVQEHRPGSEYDETALETALEKCGFNVEICTQEECTLKGIRSCLDKFKEKLEKDKNLSCCLIAMMSHGDSRDIFFTKPSPGTRFEDRRNEFHIASGLVDKFNNANCEKLGGIPKIFLINMCRGKKHDNVKSLDGPDMSYFEEFNNMFKSENKDVDGYYRGSFSDILLCYSTTKGFVSWRPPTGAWYIQELCKMLKEMADGETNFEEIIKAVDRNIKYIDRYEMQCGEYVNKGFETLKLTYKR